MNSVQVIAYITVDVMGLLLLSGQSKKTFFKKKLLTYYTYTISHNLSYIKNLSQQVEFDSSANLDLGVSTCH